LSFGRIAFLVVVMAVAGACSHADGAPAAHRRTTTTARSTSTTSSTSTTLDSRQLEVADAYRAYWKAYEAAADSCSVAGQDPCQERQANPNDPALGLHATGPPLAALVKHLRQLRKEGEVARGEVVLTWPDGTPSFTVVMSGEDNATLTDCHDASSFLAYDAATGALRDVSDPRRALWTVSMVKEPDGWKVSDIVNHSKEDQGRCGSR
jgi:hypothetical protein